MDIIFNMPILFYFIFICLINNVYFIYLFIYFFFSPRLPESFSVTRPPKGGGLQLSLDFL